MPNVPQAVAEIPQRKPRLVTPIVKPVQLLVEGPDDIAFLRAVLEGQQLAQDRIQMHPCEGKGGFVEALTSLRTLVPGKDVERVVIVRDADADAQRAARECIACFRSARYAFPGSGSPGDWPEPDPKVAGLQTSWLLVPATGPGTVETLVLDALRQDVGQPAVLAMLDHVIRARTHTGVAWPGRHAQAHAVQDAAAAHKAQVQAFLAAFVGAEYRLLVSAFREGILDGRHPAYDDLRQALCSL